MGRIRFNKDGELVNLRGENIRHIRRRKVRDESDRMQFVKLLNDPDPDIAALALKKVQRQNRRIAKLNDELDRRRK